MKHEIEIEGLPEGWRAVAYRIALRGVDHVLRNGKVTIYNGFSDNENLLIVEKILPHRIVLEETGRWHINSTEGYVLVPAGSLIDIKFPDHHAYTAAEIETIHQTAHLCNVNSILTTEKDMVKLIGGSVFDLVKKKNWFYILIQATFTKNGSDFDTMICHLIEDKLREVALA